MKKKILAVLLAVAMLFTFASVISFADDAEETVAGFKDVSADAWYAKAVEYCKDHGYMVGTAVDEFSPDGTVTRAMAITVIWRLAGAPDPQADYSVDKPFDDVGTDRWYTKAVNWGYESGYAGGVADKQFSPDEPATRAMITAMLYKYGFSRFSEPAMGYRSDLSEYEDVDVSSWYGVSVSWAVGFGLIVGRSDSIIAPNEQITRAEFAQIIYRFMSKLDPEPAPEPEPEPEPAVLFDDEANAALLEKFGFTANVRIFANYMPTTDRDYRHHDVKVKLTAAEGGSIPELTITGDVYTSDKTAEDVQFTKKDEGYFVSERIDLNELRFSEYENVEVVLTFKVGEEKLTVGFNVTPSIVW